MGKLGGITGRENHEIRDRLQDDFRQALRNGCTHLATSLWIDRLASESLISGCCTRPLSIAVPPAFRTLMEARTKRTPLGKQEFRYSCPGSHK